VFAETGPLREHENEIKALSIKQQYRIFLRGLLLGRVSLASLRCPAKIISTLIL